MHKEKSYTYFAAGKVFELSFSFQITGNLSF